MNEPRRRDSWPPTILRLHGEDLDDVAAIEDIDVNPFSYFLTSPEEIDDEVLEDLSAGIESDEDTTEPVREVSPSSLQRLTEHVDDESHMTPHITRGFALPVTLQAFTETHLSERDEKTARRSEAYDIPYHVPPIPTLRGRRTVRLAPPGGRGRGQTRSLPGGRPHAWREPSPDVWSIPEETEEEQDDSVDIISPLSLDNITSLPPQPAKQGKPSSGQGLFEQPTQSPLKKIKKKVRFALP